MVLVKLDVCMWKNANAFLFMTLHKTQVQVDQRPQCKTRYTKSNRTEVIFLIVYCSLQAELQSPEDYVYYPVLTL